MTRQGVSQHQAYVHHTRRSQVEGGDADEWRLGKVCSKWEAVLFVARLCVGLIPGPI